MKQNTLASLFAALAIILNMTRIRMSQDPDKKKGKAYQNLRTLGIISLLAAIAIMSFGQYFGLE